MSKWSRRKMYASLNRVIIIQWTCANLCQQSFRLVIVHTKFYSECNSPQIKKSVLVLKPSSLQGGPSFNLQNLLGETERIMAHAYFPYFSSPFLVFVSCISFPPWLIPCTKVEEINQHSCASDTQSFTTSTAIFLDISLKHLLYLKPGSTAA